MIKSIVLTLSLLSGMLLLPVGSAIAATDPFSEVCSQPGAGSNEVCTNEGRSGTDPLTGDQGIFMRVVNIIAIIAGIAAVIVIVVAGFQIVLSNGDSNSVSSARGAIIYSLAGLVVILLSRQIIALIITRTQ